MSDTPGSALKPSQACYTAPPPVPPSDMSSSRPNRCSRRDSREFDDFRGHDQQSGHGDRHNYGRHSPISDYRDRDRYLDGLDRTGSITHPRDGRRNVYSSGHGPRSPLSSRPNGDVDDSKKPRSTSSDSHGYAAKQASKPLPTGPRGKEFSSHRFPHCCLSALCQLSRPFVYPRFFT